MQTANCVEEKYYIKNDMCEICYVNNLNLYKFCEKCELFICYSCINQLIKNNYIYCLLCKKICDIHIRIKIKSLLNDILDQYKNTFYKFDKDRTTFGKKKKPIYYDIINNKFNIYLIHKRLYYLSKNDLEICKNLIDILIKSKSTIKKVVDVYNHVKEVLIFLINTPKGPEGY